MDPAECSGTCADTGERRTLPRKGPKGGSRRAGLDQSLEGTASAAQRLEELVVRLFEVHDLNGNGFLEEEELCTLNEKIALLHYGPHADTQGVRSKFKALFRSKLDPYGQPVPYATFRNYYILEVLDGLDPDPEAQELILEQFVAEATSACQALPHSSVDDVDQMTDVEVVDFLPLPGSIVPQPRGSIGEGLHGI